MPSPDPAAWFDNPNVHVDDKELIEHAEALEATLIHHGAWSRIGGAVWTSLIAASAGAFGGFTFSDEVRSSWAVFAAYLLAGALMLRVSYPATRKLFGDALAWQVGMAFVWSFLLATIAVLTGRMDTPWLGTTLSVAGGLFVGLMYGSLNPGYLSSQDAWLMSGLPLGALSTWSATSLQRAFDASTDPSWSEAYVGAMAASAFMVPMAAVMAALSNRANALVKLATLYLHNDNFTPKAIEYLDQAIAVRPRAADLYNLRGIAYSKSGAADRADADFKKVMELSPRSAEAHMNLGVDFMKHNQFDRAIEALTRATSINPKLAMAFSNLGTAYQKKGDLDAAITSYDRAISLRPKYPIAFSNRAYSYHLKGDHDRAIADAQRAIALDGHLAVARTNLGHALAAQGERAHAVESYRQALALSPDREVEEETLAALAALGARASDDDMLDNEDDDE
jgi:tetratricopeptide (TPR) repeat protein